MKKLFKKFVVIILILIVLFSINSKTLAWSNIIRDGKSFIEEGTNADERITHLNTAGMESSLKDLSSYLYNILLSSGIMIAAVVATILGIQATLGGAEGKAKVSEMLVPYVIGCIVVFGGFGIWRLAITIGNRIESAASIDMGRYERNADGKPICRYCRDELTAREQRNGTCSNCGRSTGI